MADPTNAQDPLTLLANRLAIVHHMTPTTVTLEDSTVWKHDDDTRLRIILDHSISGETSLFAGPLWGGPRFLLLRDDASGVTTSDLRGQWGHEAVRALVDVAVLLAMDLSTAKARNDQHAETVMRIGRRNVKLESELDTLRAQYATMQQKLLEIGYGPDTETPDDAPSDS